MIFEQGKKQTQVQKRQNTRCRKKESKPRYPGQDTPLRSLQQTLGNQAVQKLVIKGVQPKLMVGSPDDEYEREADQVAEAITGMQVTASTNVAGRTFPGDDLQRGQRRLRRHRLFGRAAGEEELRQGGTSVRTTSIGPELEGEIRSLQGEGRRLPSSVRSFFEPRFGHDLGDVRVHAGTTADNAARSLGAKAFTVGRDVAFRSGEYRPRMADGKRLLAHELTHVLQQHGGDGGHSGDVVSQVQLQRDEENKQAADELIDAHTAWWGNLDEEGLARELLYGHLLVGDVQMVHNVLDRVPGALGRNVDDVSREIIDLASDDELRTIATEKSGRDLLRRMVRVIQEGPSIFEDEDNIVQVMDAVTNAQPAAESEERDQPASDETERIDLKVITFKEGAQDPIVPESYHGHTALVVGGYVYSFDAGGWKCGITEAEYQRENAHRGAWVQVLDVPESDARQIQGDLNAACESGAYGFTGVCTSNSANFLQQSLEEVDSTWSPKRLKNRLDKSGHVKQTYEWEKGGGVAGKGRKPIDYGPKRREPIDYGPKRREPIDYGPKRREPTR